MVERVPIRAALGPSFNCPGHPGEPVPSLYGHERGTEEPLHHGGAGHIQYPATDLLLYGAGDQRSKQMEGADLVERRRIHHERYHNFPPFSTQAWIDGSQPTMGGENRYERLDPVLEEGE